jgi:nucleoside-diphosphate-sugar epimerase
VIIEAIGGTEKKGLSSSIRNAVVEAAKKLRPAGAPKLSFIYTSGVWVYGDNRKDIISDTTPVEHPLELVAWRPAEEQATLTNTVINGIVVRPAILYGRSGSLFEILFRQATIDKKISWPGTPGGKFALIHADDLADLYVRLSEGATIAGGKVFNVANDVTEDVDGVLNKLSLIAGLDGKYEYRKPSNRELSPCWSGE